MSRKISQNQDEEDKPAANITRIDIALDDYDELVKFDDIEQKLQKGNYPVIKTLVQYCQE